MTTNQITIPKTAIIDEPASAVAAHFNAAWNVFADQIETAPDDATRADLIAGQQALMDAFNEVQRLKSVAEQIRRIALAAVGVAEEMQAQRDLIAEDLHQLARHNINNREGIVQTLMLDFAITNPDAERLADFLSGSSEFYVSSYLRGDLAAILDQIAEQLFEEAVMHADESGDDDYE